MTSRAVHWHEGMFLRPHQFQAADRHARQSARQGVDWFHPYHWGVRMIDLDRDAVSNSTFVLRECEARFRDGTEVVIPADTAVDPLDLKGAFAGGVGETIVSLAIPTLQPGRACVEVHPTENGPRYWLETVSMPDENTGSDDQPVQVRRPRCRLLHGGQDPTGYETIPLARVVRSAQTDATPQLDHTFVPPLLVLDAWPPLWRTIQSLRHQISARIDQLAAQVIDRGVSFDSQVPGDAERMLKLGVLNGAFSYLETLAYVRGLPALPVYQELCRLVGQLALFRPERRPRNLPPYDHDDLGTCFQTVIREIQLGLDTAGPTAFEKRYLERAAEKLQASIEQPWTTAAKKLFLGVETELDDQACQALLDSMDMKMASGPQVENIFRRRLEGLRLTPVARPPRALPAGAGVVYFQVDRDQVFWRDVVDSLTIGLRLNLAHARFSSERTLVVDRPDGGKPTTLQFALYVI